MPLVRIKPGLSHGYYDTAARSHAYRQAGDVLDATPAEMESFGDKFILVKPPVDESGPPLVEIDATPGARKLAAEHGIILTLSDITGTGRGGKITKADVQAALDGNIK